MTVLRAPAHVFAYALLVLPASCSRCGERPQSDAATPALGSGAPSEGAPAAGGAPGAPGATAEVPAAPLVEGSAPSAPPIPAPEIFGWRKSIDLTEEQAAMVAAAEQTRARLQQRLVQTLTQALSGGDTVAALDACRVAAPEVTRAAQTTDTRLSIAVGRTSDRLRNPDNEPPEWVRSVLTTADPEGVWLGPDIVGTVSPIRAAPLCLPCHGGPEHVQPDVSAAISAAYPQDRALGYAEGDLRGWFWTEVVRAD